MFVYIQSVLVVLLEILCCKIFFESFGSKRHPDAFFVNVAGIAVLIFLTYFMAVFLDKYLILKEILIILATAVIMFGMLNISLLKAIILSALFQGLVLLVDYFVLLLNVAVFQSTAVIEQVYYVQGSLLVILGKAILFLIVLLISHSIGQKSSAVLLDSEWLRFLFFPIFTICTLIALVLTSGSIHNQETDDLFFVIAFGLAGMNIVVFYLMNDILEREMQLRESKIFEVQVKNQTDMYRAVSENFDNQRKKTHEYKNQMMCIDALIEKREYGQLEAYVQNICGKLNRELDAINTNHVIVNAIMNTKYQEALSKNILFVFQMNDLSALRISDEDIVVILANLLNNAIEACEKCKGKRIIKVKFVIEDENVILSVRNTHENNLVFQNNEIQTSKETDMEEHGIGIRNIIQTIEKYGGSYVIRPEENEFYFSIVIPQ
jgi:two-component system sensor histidine kinase AgrC